MRVCDRCATVKDVRTYGLEEKVAAGLYAGQDGFHWNYDLCTSCEKELRLRLQQFLINDLSGKVLSHD